MTIVEERDVAHHVFGRFDDEPPGHPTHISEADAARVAALAELDRLSAQLGHATRQLKRFMAITEAEPVAVSDAAHCLHRAQAALGDARSALSSAASAWSATPSFDP